jgi:hypothetical protein
MLLSVGAGFWGRPGVEPAVYKDLARSLSVQGASVDKELSGVAGVVTVVRNDRVPLRSAPGLSLQAPIMPPPQRAVFLDGDAVGAIGVHRDPAQAAEYFGHLVSALPFVLRQPTRVAVLHAAVRQGVPQAISLGATQITAIEPTPQLYDLVCGTYPDLTGRACDTSLVDCGFQQPRTFLAAHSRHFDLITLNAEEDAAGTDALKINFDLTIEAFGSYLQHLSERGLVAVEGGTRVPPRLALRLLQTARDALLRSGVEHPDRHIAMIRGWQRFVLLVSKTPLTGDDESAVRRFSTSLGFDLIWLPHIQAADANRFQVLHEPYFYRAAAALFNTSTGHEPVFEHYRLQAMDDDRPFPLLFTRWSVWWGVIVSGDKDAVSRLDAGLLIGTLILALVAIASLVFILLPLWLMRQALPASASPGPRFQTLLYFGLLGIAFLFLEIGWIQRLQLFLGHPVYATTALISAFLIFAGLGSLWSQGSAEYRVAATLRLSIATIILFSLVYLLFLPDWLEHLAGLSILGRIIVVFLLLAPLAFAMGIPFSTGLRRLGNSASHLVPWAWGINGCASVISAAIAPLLAVETGFSGLMMAAAGAYLLLPLFRLEEKKSK